ncbi:MAG TPA: hypothetical protein VFQ38_01970 [Longimicrobiales bacterium]|nr:hypothetical protein [Longimicrobiales bacterium]
MHRLGTGSAILLVGLVLAAGCRADRDASREDGSPATAGQPATPPGGGSTAQPAPPTAGTNAPSQPTPPTGGTAAQSPPTADTAGTAADAVAVIRAYYAAIARRDYAAAYGLWGDGGRASGQTLEAFRRGYARTAAVEVTPGEPGRIEGAAGSRYVRLPVEVRARTSDGARQCFRGAYTLRRTVVDGAPPEERRWHIYTAELHAADPAACAGEPPAAAAPAEVEALVRRFGEGLARVSLLAPVDTVRRELREAFGALVTRRLLDAWLASPGSAPGRAASSPWPDRIEIRRASRVAPNEYRVDGDVVYVTSVEKVRGGAAARKPVTLRIVRGEGGWRIAGYEAGR